MIDRTMQNIRHMARWKNNSIRILGMVEIVLGLLCLLPAIVAVAYGENAIGFLVPAPILLIAGFLQYTLFYGDHRIAPSVCILLMAVAWLIAFGVFSVPYIWSGFTWYDAIFESVSGFTTTGASVLSDPGSADHALLFWRSFSQWVGGLAVVVVFMILLPMMGVGGRMFMNNELTGTDTANFSYKMMSVAKSFIYIYLLLTAFEIIVLGFLGLPFFDGLCVTLSNISTGGFVITGNNIGEYSVFAQATVLVFMFLGGTNFFLHYRFLYKRDFNAYMRNKEFVTTLIWFIMATVVISILIITTDNSLRDAKEIVWDAAFTVVSIGTSSGFSIHDYSGWPVATSAILCIIGFIGAMSGSTAGGMKIYRFMIIRSYISYGFQKMLHPNAVMDVKSNNDSVNSDNLMSTLIVGLCFIGTFVAATILFCILEPNISVLDSLGLSMGSVCNVGLGLGNFGPCGSVADLSVATKMVMSILMWVGRLEVFMVLILFSRSFWKDFRLNLNKSSTMREGRFSLMMKRR